MPDRAWIGRNAEAELLPISRCRELLGDEATDLSDDEIEVIRRHAKVMAHTLIELALEGRDRF